MLTHIDNFAQVDLLKLGILLSVWAYWGEYGNMNTTVVPTKNDSDVLLCL